MTDLRSVYFAVYQKGRRETPCRAMDVRIWQGCLPKRSIFTIYNNALLLFSYTLGIGESSNRQEEAIIKRVNIGRVVDNGRQSTNKAPNALRRSSFVLSTLK